MLFVSFQFREHEKCNFRVFIEENEKMVYNVFSAVLHSARSHQNVVTLEHKHIMSVFFNQDTYEHSFLVYQILT